jgi:excisionase family DNA binding protein
LRLIERTPMDHLALHSLPTPELIELIKRAVREELASSRGPGQQGEQLMSRQETAAYLGITLPTLRQHTRHGALKAYRIGRRVLYRHSELLESLQPMRFKKIR